MPSTASELSDHAARAASSRRGWREWLLPSRSMPRRFWPFILTGVLFDSMRYFYWQGIAGRVHVVEPYLFERAWFGVGGRTLNEVFLTHHWAVLDLLCGFAYLVYVGEYLAMAFLLFWRGQHARVSTFARSFLIVNVMGYVTYFAYAAAPPWYVTEYGLGPRRRSGSMHSSAPASSTRCTREGWTCSEPTPRCTSPTRSSRPSLRSGWPSCAGPAGPRCCSSSSCA